MSNFDLSDARALTSSQLVTAPDALQPHFKWNVQVPLDWMYLVTDPERTQASVEGIVTDLFGTNTLDSEKRAEIVSSLSDTALKARKNKLLFTFIFPVQLEDNSLSTCMLFLRWHNFAPTNPTMQLADNAFGSKLDYQHRLSRNGVEYASFSQHIKHSETAAEPSMWNHQTFTPVPRSTWACLVAGSTPVEQLSKAMQHIVIRMTESLRFFPDVPA